MCSIKQVNPKLVKANRSLVVIAYTVLISLAKSLPGWPWVVFRHAKCLRIWKRVLQGFPSSPMLLLSNFFCLILLFVTRYQMTILLLFLLYLTMSCKEHIGDIVLGFVVSTFCRVAINLLLLLRSISISIELIQSQVINFCSYIYLCHCSSMSCWLMNLETVDELGFLVLCCETEYLM